MGHRALFVALALCVIVVSVAALPAAESPKPYAPAEDDEILEHLPVAALDPAAREPQGLRRELAARRDNIDLAVRVARQYVEQGRMLADPRYYGYAQAALTPWWAADAPPVPILVLRATIRQHNHAFPAALKDLSLALRSDPGNAQAWLTRAVVLQVVGEYAEARQSCLQVLQLATPLVAVTCVAHVDSLCGAAPAAIAMLRKALANAPQANRASRVWALTTLAEIAARSGDSGAAETYFQQALALDDNDAYLRGAYADFLLDIDRPSAARDLLRERTRVDALLLRLAIADQRLSAPEVHAHVEALHDRFDAARLRGDSVHRREEARFALHLLHEPDVALRLARENWEIQREPADARILLESALAAHEPAAAQGAAAFLARSGTEDVTLAPLITALQAVSSQ